MEITETEDMKYSDKELLLLRNYELNKRLKIMEKAFDLLYEETGEHYKDARPPKEWYVDIARTKVNAREWMW